jgi:thiamine biosynthesis protein ThiI
MGVILVRYGEIALKGKNRNTFTRQLRRNLRAALRANGLAGSVWEEGRRMYVETDDVPAALGPLSRVFGVVSLSPITYVERSLEAMAAEALRMAGEFGLGPGKSFRIEARRSDKTFPVPSPEIGRLVGEAVYEKLHARVDLTNPPDLTIGIEVQRERAVMYGAVVAGLGGMPLPTAGRAVALISGGIDSPVAIWMMMKRGCGVIPLHFSQHPAETQKVLDNIKVLEQYAYGWRLQPMILSHAELMAPVLTKLRELGQERWSCVFCKRAMLQKAAEIADELGCQAIIMGDSLGQVASQTMHNLEVISYGVQKPILRPLIGMDKVEIAALARRIGTFDISTRLAEGCPFLPANPITQGSLQSLKDILGQMARLDAPAPDTQG